MTVVGRRVKQFFAAWRDCIVVVFLLTLSSRQTESLRFQYIVIPLVNVEIMSIAESSLLETWLTF